MPNVRSNSVEELDFFNPTDEQCQKLSTYMDCVLTYNQHTNIISRNITRPALGQLLKESVMLHPLVSAPVVVDAGSGNGLLGIPLSILKPIRRVVLVESRQKKVNFLRQAKIELNILPLYIEHMDIQQYIYKQKGNRNITLVARGFPRLDILAQLLAKKQIRELILITSCRKLKKNQKELEKFRQKLYNIPLRDEIMVVKMENVSRET